MRPLLAALPRRATGVILLVTTAFAVIGASSAARAAAPPKAEADQAAVVDRLFGRDNLIAWCIVPFDAKNRPPEARAAMLAKLGFKHFAYDWRAEHVPSFDAEVDALKKHNVRLDAWWCPGELNADSQRILEVLKRHGVKAQLWVLLGLGDDKATGAESQRRIGVAAGKLEPLAREAAKIGCTLGLYNHGGWFGEPENQLGILEALKAKGVTNVGLVYNLHHGHDHLDRFRVILPMIKPYLYALNLNGMDPQGDRAGRKILPLGQGSLDLSLLQTIRDSGYNGPIGILGHTQDDAEQRLQDNLDGLDWLIPQLKGQPAGPAPKPRTPVPPRPKASVDDGYDRTRVDALLRNARTQGDASRGAALYASAKLACVNCHKIGPQGGTIGPELTAAGACLAPDHIVESILYPRRVVKDGYQTLAVATHDGKIQRGYPLEETRTMMALRDPSTGNRLELNKGEVEEIKNEGTLMPDGLFASLTPSEQRDLVRFLLDLGRPGGVTADLLRNHMSGPAEFAYDRPPLRPALWPSRNHRVNRDRIYDFYAKEAAYFTEHPGPMVLPQFPGLDGGKEGHWGNQNEDYWADGRWNDADLGTLLAGVFRGNGVTVAKGVCVRLGDRGELATCFNPQTLQYEAVWKDGFVRFSPTRHGFMDGLLMVGSPLPAPEPGPAAKAKGPVVYHGFYRHGKRVLFSYTVDGVAMLDAPWVENGRFVRQVGPAATHPLRDWTRGGEPQWPAPIVTKGQRGADVPGVSYAVDTIEPPFANPWKAPLFFGDHDFLPDGSALLATIQGDVWHVSGLDDNLANVRWRRFASGLHQSLGLLVHDGKAYAIGRDQITRLHDLDGDGEADFYECVTNAFFTSPAAHDFVCGLQRDAAGNFYSASGPQGLIRIAADGKTVETIATGLRNPDGLGLGPDGTLTVPNSEGDWVPASMVCEIVPGTKAHFGYKGPLNNKPPTLPLVYMPRGLDNSSGGQVFVPDDRFGPLRGQLLHLSFGAGTWFLVLRERIDGQPQGAAVPMPGEFLSGSHRARFNPKDGQLYVSGMAGWGTYTVADGSFQRVRYNGQPSQIPVGFHAHQNGVLLQFARPLDPAQATRVDRQFAQAWNYKYSGGYGSSELSPTHPGMSGHDRLIIRSAQVLADGKSLFLEIPDIQPVNQLHLALRVDEGVPINLFATVHKLAAPFTGFNGYRPVEKTIAAHPILADMVALNVKPVPNPFRGRAPGARVVTIEAGKNLSYVQRTLKARPGEPLRLTFSNPDVIPHNWVLIREGSLTRFGDKVNRIVAEPDAAMRHYVPKSDDMLAYTDIVAPGESFTIEFRAPQKPGTYPYLCTFPGHWMVMNGTLIVE